MITFPWVVSSCIAYISLFYPSVAIILIRCHCLSLLWLWMGSTKHKNPYQSKRKTGAYIISGLHKLPGLPTVASFLFLLTPLRRENECLDLQDPVINQNVKHFVYKRRHPLITEKEKPLWHRKWTVRTLFHLPMRRLCFYNPSMFRKWHFTLPCFNSAFYTILYLWIFGCPFVYATERERREEREREERRGEERREEKVCMPPHLSCLGCSRTEPGPLCSQACAVALYHWTLIAGSSFIYNYSCSFWKKNTDECFSNY